MARSNLFLNDIFIQIKVVQRRIQVFPEVEWLAYVFVRHLSTYYSSLNRSFYASAVVLLVRHPVVTRIGDNFITEREWVGMFI